MFLLHDEDNLIITTEGGMQKNLIFELGAQEQIAIYWAFGAHVSI